MADNENAEGLARAMLDAGREPLWCVLVVGWYFGQAGREAALALLEERNAPSLD
jgi:hypothetical protein